MFYDILLALVLQGILLEDLSIGLALIIADM